MILRYAWLPHHGAVIHLCRWVGSMEYAPFCFVADRLVDAPGGSWPTLQSVPDWSGRTRTFNSGWLDEVPHNARFCAICLTKADSYATQLADTVASLTDRNDLGAVTSRP